MRSKKTYIYEHLQLQATPNVPDQDYDMFDFAHKFKNEIIAYADILPSLGSPEDFPTYVTAGPESVVCELPKSNRILFFNQ